MAIGSILTAIGLTILYTLLAKERYLKAKAERQVIENKIITAPREHQIFVIRGNEINPIHDWSYSSVKPQIEPNNEVLEPILPLLVDSQRLIIAGGSDAGKTTLVKHIISGRRNHSKIVIIDPHSPSRILGIDVIGAGRDYPAIGDALESLVLLMTARYEDVKAGVLGYFEHDRISVFIDEWTSISREIKEAGNQLAILLTESRKVNIHLTICSHTLTVDGLGLPDAQFKKSATLVEIIGGNGQPRKGFILPRSKLNGKPIEYLLPGPFIGYVEPTQEVLRLPDSKSLKAQILRLQGFSNTAIARELFGVDKATGGQINAIKEMLETT